jgi:hypothetical protein
VAEHVSGPAGAQHVAVIDAVRAERHRRDERHDLAARMRRARPITQVDRLVDQLFDSNRVARAAGSITPAFATARSSSKTTTAESFTMQVTSWDGPRQPQSVATKPDLGGHLAPRAGRNGGRG